MPKKDGGPAFPRVPTRIEYRAGEALIDEGQEGMKLRDYFAAHAMKAMIEKFPIVKYRDPKETAPSVPLVTKEQGEEIRSAIAKVAYEYADAMIEERDK